MSSVNAWKEGCKHHIIIIFMDLMGVQSMAVVMKRVCVCIWVCRLVSCNCRCVMRVHWCVSLWSICVYLHLCSSVCLSSVYRRLRGPAVRCNVCNAKILPGAWGTFKGLPCFSWGPASTRHQALILMLCVCVCHCIWWCGIALTPAQGSLWSA